MPALHPKTPRLVVANPRHGPSYGCGLRLDAGCFGAPFGHGEKLSGSEPAAAVARPRPEQGFLAFDPGLRRVGVASGNTLLERATPLRTLSVEGDARWAAIASLIGQWRPDALVVGVPFHPDGAAHDMTRRARRFARQLHGRFGLPVHEVDERYSTTEALADGARDADAAAAAIILEQHLRARQRVADAIEVAPDAGGTNRDMPRVVASGAASGKASGEVADVAA